MTQKNEKSDSFANNPKRASDADKKGSEKKSGNFKDNPEKAAEAGRKGGQKSKKDQ